MKKTFKACIILMLVLSICLIAATSYASESYTTRVTDPAIPAFGDTEAVQTYWNYRHTFEQYEALFDYLAAQYPNTVKKYAIGRSWEERTIWCLEISSNGKSAGKTPIAVIGNIHGGEHESGESVAYTAWWLAAGFHAKDSQVTEALDGYVYYIIPVMNPDGYVRSMYVNTRQNMRPRGLGRDEYFDRNGDGKVGHMFAGLSGETPPFAGGTPSTSNNWLTSNYAKNFSEILDAGQNYLGLEAYDTDRTGIFGDSTKQSSIDLNRSFDYLWTLYRPANTFSIGDNYPHLGADGTWNDDPTRRSAGPGPASEPEVQAIQNFLTINPPRALITAHTGIQCVLYPWCYTPEPTEDHAFLADTAEKMRAAYEATVQKVRPNVRFYAKQSYNDYPTAAEMIDWAYGRLGIHAYTVEVYSTGTPSGAAYSDRDCRWDDAAYWTDNFPAQWKYVGEITDGQSGNNSKTYENVWAWYTSAQMRAGEAPPDQYIMTEGFKDCMLAMANSEDKYSPHPGAPEWMKWALLTPTTGW